jgi:hypothetical protein
MTIARGFAITIVSGVAFGIFGAVVGYALGTFAPDYYRTVFRIPPGVELDPVQTGLGLGVTQGLTAGLFIGLAIVVTVAWYESRATQNSA